MCGGLLAGGVYIALGAPGTGKTVLGNQLCFTAARRNDAAIYVTLLAESHDRLLANLRSLAFFDESLVSTRIHYFSGYGVLEESGVAGLLVTLQRLVTEKRAAMLVLDGFGALVDFAESEAEIKKFLQEFAFFAALTGCTTLLLSGRKKAGDEAIVSLADGIIELLHSLGNFHGGREIQLTKLSGSDIIEGAHTYVIDPEGFVVYPRREALVPPDADLSTHPAYDRLRFGIGDLDAMLDGGVVRGTSTLVQGPSGSGKSVFGLHFLNAEPAGACVYFGYGKSAAECLAVGDSLGLGLRNMHDEGRLIVYVERKLETPVDVVAARILAYVTSRNAARVFIDDLEHFETVATRSRLRPFMISLTESLCLAGATTIMAHETSPDRDSAKPVLEMPSGFADNHVSLRLEEIGGELRQTCVIGKMRRSGYDNRIRPFRITAHGVAFDAVGERRGEFLATIARRRRGWGLRHGRAHSDR